MEELFRGTWYRSLVKLEKVSRHSLFPGEEQEVEKIVPIPPFEPYNPFDWYYSASNVRQGEKSLYLEFLAVDSDKPEEVLNFCERFGVLGDAPETAEWVEDKGGQPVRSEYSLAYDPEWFESNDKMIAALTFMPKDRLITPKKLCPPQSIASFKAQQTVLRNAFSPDPKIFSKCSPSQLKDITRTFTNNFLKDSHVQPQLQWNVQKDRWELLWVSYDLFGYLFIMLMLDLLGPGKILSCPRCHKFFMTASNLMKFCSPPCYEVFKVQKYQRKKKEKKLAAQKGKKGKASISTTKKK